MGKRKLALCLLLVFLAGVSAGAGGYWYWGVHLPQQRLLAYAREQQQKLNAMVRSGTLLELKSGENKLTLRVEKSGDESVVGQAITVKYDPQRTTIQRGTEFLNREGPVDLDQYLKPGMWVDLLVDGEEAKVIHFRGQEEGKNASQTGSQPSPGPEQGAARQVHGN